MIVTFWQPVYYSILSVPNIVSNSECHILGTSLKIGACVEDSTQGDKEKANPELMEVLIYLARRREMLRDTG